MVAADRECGVQCINITGQALEWSIRRMNGGIRDGTVSG